MERLRVRLDDGDFERDARTLGRQVFNFQISATALGDCVTDAQSEAGALAFRLGGIEGVEGAAEIGKTGARVIHLNEDAGAGVIGANRDLTNARRVVQRVSRIVEKIQQNLLDFIFIDGERRQIGSYVGFYLQVRRSNAVFAKGEHFLHDGSELRGSGVRRTPARKAKQSVGDALHAASFAQQALEMIVGA